MRVEKRIMVTVTWSLIFNGARAHTKKHSALVVVVVVVAFIYSTVISH